MKKITTILAATAFALVLAGCSDETKEKWKQAGSAAVDATKETAEDVKEGSKELASDLKEGTHKMTEKAKEIIHKADVTDPDTGEAVNQGTN